jgi:mannose/fructose/N-acetylgalactosamine-specific phosphotransferase system component IIB
MIKQYNINGLEWTAISTAGQIGTLWIESLDDGFICVFHSDTVTPDESIKKVSYKMKAGEVVQLIPDNQNDIYYVRCNTTSDVAIITADVKDY